MVDRVTLYRAPTTVASVDAIGDWLANRVDASVEVRDRFLDDVLGRVAEDAGDEDAEDEHAGGEDAGDEDAATALAEEFAAARVLSPYERETGNTMLGIVRYEERALSNPERAGGVIYDGQQVQDALRKRIDADERSLAHLHIPILDRVVGTWGDHDGRWHKRVNVLGQPGIVSVPGLYEAPAKPEQYYKEQQKQAMVSGDSPPREVLENQVDGKFLVEDDPRTTEALKGYVLQCYHYLETGEGFCEDERCRLSNPHRQPGVVAAQLEEPEFCATHRDLYG